jgi:hypothetical protein
MTVVFVVVQWFWVFHTCSVWKTLPVTSSSCCEGAEQQLSRNITPGGNRSCFWYIMFWRTQDLTNRLWQYFACPEHSQCHLSVRKNFLPDLSFINSAVKTSFDLDGPGRNICVQNIAVEWEVNLLCFWRSRFNIFPEIFVVFLSSPLTCQDCTSK